MGTLRHVGVPTTPGWDLAWGGAVSPDFNLHLPRPLWRQVTPYKGKEATGSLRNYVHWFS